MNNSRQKRWMSTKLLSREKSKIHTTILARMGRAQIAGYDIAFDKSLTEI